MPELEYTRLITLLRWIEDKILDTGDEMQMVFGWIWSSGELGLHLLWRVMHLIVSIWYFVLHLVCSLESILISTGFLKRYRSLDISKVRYLAVVIDSEEAAEMSKVLELLKWLKAVGLENVCLYDAEGVLKKFKDSIALRLKSEELSKESTTSEALRDEEIMSLEIISLSDGKHAVAKAANFLLQNHYLNAKMENPNLTESNLTDALKAIGYGCADPDLMLIYGPARCHLGFPPWRIRYTEIVHMGTLKSMRFGALVKAIYRFTMVHQNYGK